MSGLAVSARLAAAGSSAALGVDYLWTAAVTAPHESARLRLQVKVTPEGHWPFPLPRLGLALSLPGDDAAVEWFGLGPGEAYRDSQSAARVGRFTSTVAAMQTPYLRPQENGNRRHVRRARITADDGTLLVYGHPFFELTLRPWDTAALTAAEHPRDLRPEGRIHLHVDHSHHGLGSASCGPQPPPPHTLAATPTTFTVEFAVA